MSKFRKEATLLFLLLFIAENGLRRTAALSEPIIGVEEIFSLTENNKLDSVCIIEATAGRFLWVGGIKSNNDPLDYFAGPELSNSLTPTYPESSLGRLGLTFNDCYDGIIAARKYNPAAAVDVNFLKGLPDITKLRFSYLSLSSNEMISMPFLLPGSTFLIVGRQTLALTTEDQLGFKLSFFLNNYLQKELSTSNQLAGNLMRVDYRCTSSITQTEVDSYITDLNLNKKFYSFAFDPTNRLLVSINDAALLIMDQSSTPVIIQELAVPDSTAFAYSSEITTDGKYLAFIKQLAGTSVNLYSWKGYSGPIASITKLELDLQSNSAYCMKLLLNTYYSVTSVARIQLLKVVDVSDLTCIANIQFKENVIITYISYDPRGGFLVPVYSSASPYNSKIFRIWISSTTHPNLQSVNPLAINICGTDVDTCGACHSGCKSCQAANFLDCLSCYAPQVLSNGSCINCTPGTYFLNDQCLACSSTCLTCQDTTGICLTCRIDYLLFGGSCVASCPQGTFKNSEICSVCDSSCKSCEGPLNTQCLSCDNTSSLPVLEGNYCKSSCSLGKSPYNGICFDCQNGCDECSFSGNGVSFCLQCSSNLYLYQGVCTETCPRKTFPEIGTNVCQSCLGSCETCLNASECLTCDQTAGLFIHLFEHQCFSSCPNGTFIDPDNKSCIKCNPDCKTCSSSNKCDSCYIESANKFFYNEKCIRECPVKTYSINSSIPKCLDCDGYIFENTCGETCPNNLISQDGYCICSPDTKLINGRCSFELLIISKLYEPATKEVRIQFNEEIKQVDPASLQFVFSDESHDSLLLPPESASTIGDLLTIKFFFNESVNQATLKIDKMNSSSAIGEIGSRLNNDTIFSRFPIMIPNITFYRGALDATIKTTAQITGATVNGAMGLLMLVNFPVFFTLLKLFQVVEYITYLNINIPGNAENLLMIFSFDLTQMIPNFIHIDEKSMNYVWSIPSKISENGFECLYINNMGSPLIQITGVAFLALIAGYCKKKIVDETNMKESKFKKISIFFAEVFSLRKVIEFMLSSQITTIFSILISSSSKKGIFGGSSAVAIVSSIIGYAFTALILLIIAVFIVINILYLFPKRDDNWNVRHENIQKRWYAAFISLLGEVNFESRLAGLSFMLILIRDTLFPIWIYMFMESPYLQTLPLVGFLAFKGAFIAWKRPYKSIIQNIITATNDLMTALLILSFTLVKIAEDHGVNDETRYLYNGNLIIILLVIILAMNFVMTIGSQIWSSYKWCRLRYSHISQIIRINQSSETNLENFNEQPIAPEKMTGEESFTAQDSSILNPLNQSSNKRQQRRIGGRLTSRARPRMGQKVPSTIRKNRTKRDPVQV